MAKNNKLKADHFGIFLALLVITISIFGYERIIEFSEFLMAFLVLLTASSVILITFKKQLQPIMDKHSHDEWALYTLIYVGLAFILDYITNTFNIPFIITLIIYIPLGLGIGRLLRPKLKIR